MTAYYNENNDYCVQWLRNLSVAGLIARGDIDSRSIVDVQPEDLAGYDQCHFFAGIGGWSLAARLADWPDERPLWTGSCPCQPFSLAGKGLGIDDSRHLWPDLFRLVSACRPPLVVGEQVASAVGAGWLDSVFDDLEGIDYACRAVVVPACSLDAPHRRERLWFLADATVGGRDVSEHLVKSPHGVGIARQVGADGVDALGADGTLRRTKPGVPFLAHGVLARVAQLRALGNAIVPHVGAEMLAAFMEARP